MEVGAAAGVNAGCSGGGSSTAAFASADDGGNHAYLRGGYDCDGDGLEDPRQRPWQWCRASHIELILDANRWARMLPATIEAVVVTKRCRATAQRPLPLVGFLKRYGLDDGPAVAYDPQRAARRRLRT